jgi:phosphomannomutase
MTEQGADVVDIGLSTSPMLYWACAFFDFDGGKGNKEDNTDNNE